jgi:lipoic acid synthetase
MRPSKKNPPVAEYIRPEAFMALREEALGMGFRHVASSPLVRSSMDAEEMYHTEDRVNHV